MQGPVGVRASVSLLFPWQKVTKVWAGLGPSWSSWVLVSSFVVCFLSSVFCFLTFQFLFVSLVKYASTHRERATTVRVSERNDCKGRWNHGSDS